MIILLISQLILAVIMAFFVGKLVSKFRLPAILGWLITGMILGPHMIGLLSNQLLDASWYQPILNFFECSMGIMVGSELVFKELKKSGKQIVVATLFQSLSTFVVVSLFFGVIFYFTNVPLYLAFIFGAIALATAPAPALSIVKEFNANGPVTKTLIPMAVLDDVVAIVVFFSVISFVSASNSGKSTPLYLVLLFMVALPILIGAAIGLLAGVILKKECSKISSVIKLSLLVVLVAGVGYAFNHYILDEPMLNFLLIGGAFSATFVNMLSEERTKEILEAYNPILLISLIVVILNLGAPLDYRLILGAGMLTVVYIISRALGKYFGAFFGAKTTKMPKTVEKYLGFVLLPHSGVSLVFTGIAASALYSFDPTSATLLQGTIAAAAVINEIIAVILSKKAFEWAGELTLIQS